MLEVDLDADDEWPDIDLPQWLPCVVVGSATDPRRGAPSGVDVALCSGERDTPPGWVHASDLTGELERLGRCIVRDPQAAVTLAQVLRTTERFDVGAGLLVESLAYSTLQSGPSFTSWLASRPPPAAAAHEDRVLLAERDEGTLRLTLHRPHVRNALNHRLRDELTEALAIACADSSVTRIVLRGAGPSFCSGGDLHEFGTMPDPATAHLTRTVRSPGRLLATLGPRVEARVHGACVGAGIELAAFAGRVVAAPDSQFSLPEVGMGLIPGAGGTVSIPRRIGRQRAAWLALGGSMLDAAVARRWGLVDELADG